MKKTNKLFLAMCVAGSFALLFGSCKKNEESEKVMVNLPAFEEEVETRAYIDYNNGGSFKWNANDEIMVYNLTNPEAQIEGTSKKAIYATDASAQGQASTYFNFKEGEELGEKMYGYFVFYPTSKVTLDALNENNMETFTVEPIQEYTYDPNENPTVDPKGMALACTVDALSGAPFTLKHIFGNLKIRLTGAQTQTVTSIVVEDARFNLSGTASMKLHQVDMNKFSSLLTNYTNLEDPYGDYTWATGWNEYKDLLNYSAQGGGNTITLECNNGVTLNPNRETLFLIGLRPGALKYGFKIYVYLEGDETPYVFDYTGNNNLHYGIKAGVNKNLVLSLPY